MAPWVRLPSETGDDGLFTHFWWKFSTQPLPGTLTKNNIKETSSKVTIWGTFDMYKCEGFGGGYIIRKYYVMKISI